MMDNLIDDLITVLQAYCAGTAAMLVWNIIALLT